MASGGGGAGEAVADYLHELFGLQDRKAVVIGGTGVLCGQMALALARAGAEVVVAGRSAERGQERCAVIQQAGGHAHFLPVDVSQRDSIANLQQAAEDLLGRVDILINGAGVNSARPFTEITDEEWQQILQTNLTSVHQACQLFTPAMIGRGRGSIINITSVSAVLPLSRVFAYSASKAALLNYSQNLARELAPAGVRVNCLSPGFFPAEQNRAILDEQRVAKIMGKTPMQRFGEPDELDGAVVLLASDRAGRFITGANLLVDGGFTAMSI